MKISNVCFQNDIARRRLRFPQKRAQMAWSISASCPSGHIQQKCTKSSAKSVQKKEQRGQMLLFSFQPQASLLKNIQIMEMRIISGGYWREKLFMGASKLPVCVWLSHVINDLFELCHKIDDSSLLADDLVKSDIANLSISSWKLSKSKFGSNILNIFTFLYFYHTLLTLIGVLLFVLLLYFFVYFYLFYVYFYLYFFYTSFRLSCLFSGSISLNDGFPIIHFSSSLMSNDHAIVFCFFLSIKKTM